MNNEQDKVLNEAIVRYLWEDAFVMMLILQRDGTIVEANRGAREITGISDPRGRPFVTILVYFSEEDPLESIRSSDEDRTPLTVETVNGMETYEFRFIESGDSIIAFGEKNTREDEILRANLVELNSEFSNMSRELQKKTAELEKLNDLKNQFIGTAAHDLRNPIGAIRNLTSVLLKDSSGTLKPEHAEILEMIEKSSTFILSLLDDLLSIARIESGKLDLKIKPENIVSFIRDNIKANRIFATSNKVTVRFDHLEDLPPVPFDRVKIEQVMNNLLSNAIKYSPEGGSVVVAVFRSEERVTVTVTDQGPGVPEKDRDGIFEPFNRSGVQAPRGESSTGLGLAIARNIIVGHLGDIGIRSAEGSGSTFYFSLPLERREATAAP